MIHCFPSDRELRERRTSAVASPPHRAKTRRVGDPVPERAASMLHCKACAMQPENYGVFRPSEIRCQSLRFSTCHPERSAGETRPTHSPMGAESKDPGTLSCDMLSQGVGPMLCLRTSIFCPQCSARSSHRGFIFSIRAIFLDRLHSLSCFSRAIPFFTPSKLS